MSLRVDVEVPVTLSGKALEKNRIRANGVPQAEDETQGPLDDMNQFQHNLEEARREAFDQGFQDGWITGYDSWATFAFNQQRPPMHYQYPIRPGLGGGLGGLGLGLRNRNPQQPRQNQPLQDSNLSHLPRPRGGLHEWARHVRARGGDLEVETHRTGPPHEFLQPGDLPGLFDNNQGASDMSEANPNTTNNVWMRGGGGGEKDNPRNDAATPGLSRKPQKNQQSNAPQPQTSSLVPDRTIYPREWYSSSSRPSQATREEPIQDELPLDINFIPVLTWYPWESPHARSLREEAARREHIRKERARRDAARRSDADAGPVSSQTPQRRPQNGQGNAGDEYAGPHCTGCSCKRRA